MTQPEMVMQYLDDFGSITPVDAFRDLGVYRLSACIFVLRKRGNDIITTVEQSTNRYGKTVRYARYRLGEENAKE